MPLATAHDRSPDCLDLRRVATFDIFLHGTLHILRHIEKRCPYFVDVDVRSLGHGY